MLTKKLTLAELPDKIFEEKDYFEASSKKKRDLMLECFRQYTSDAPKVNTISNLFIPKTHEAVEMLSSYFAGINQTVKARATEAAYMKHAKIGQELLDYQWKMKLGARSKVIVWIKQCILFGNGVMKVGWDYDKGFPTMTVINLPDVYFDYYIADIQKSPVIHKLVKLKDELLKNKTYTQDFVKLLITGAEDNNKDEGLDFGQYDYTSAVAGSRLSNKTTIYEYFSNDGEIITVGKTSLGNKVLKRVDSDFKDDNGNHYNPFVKIICKNSPLANRAYDIGAIEATLNIQKAFNEAVNQFYDNVSLINNKQWVKRRGADVTNLNRKAGNIIIVDDINADLKSEEVSDVKGSLMELIRFLDTEFQQASMVVNLMKGVGGANFASEAMVGQQNVLNLFETVNQNVQDGMSELGQMLMQLNMSNLEGNHSLKILDTDEETVFIQANKEMIKGKYVVDVVADRKPQQSSAVRSKQLLDFLGIVSRDQTIIAEYPELPKKVYKKWLDEQGIGDSDWFFEKSKVPVAMQGAPEMPGMPTPAPTAKLMSPGSMEATGGAGLEQALNNVKL